jgi:hypothetical protein
VMEDSGSHLLPHDGNVGDREDRDVGG